jgi:hypothetical protein
MAPVGFEHTFSAGERPQTYALERAATGTDGLVRLTFHKPVIYVFLLHTLNTVGHAVAQLVEALRYKS